MTDPCFAMTRNPSKAILVSLKEKDLALWRLEEGGHIIQHHGRYWEILHKGFAYGIHWLGQLNAREATHPTPFCWGYRTTLAEDDSRHANAFMSAHLARNVTDYDMQFLPSKRRNQLRSCHRQVEIVEVTDATFLRNYAYDVSISASKRTGFCEYGRILSREQFANRASREIKPGHSIVLAGMIKGQLGGYVSAFAVEGTAYVNRVILATEALKTSIGTGLIFELMQVCRRTGTIREVVYGLHSREDEALCKFKEEMGFPVVKIPARVWMFPFTEILLRRYRPHVHYRLFGEKST
jgi:hypothetical protein